MLILRLHSHSDLSWTSEHRADTVQPQALKFNETIGQIKTIFSHFTLFINLMHLTNVHLNNQENLLLVFIYAMTHSLKLTHHLILLQVVHSIADQ